MIEAAQTVLKDPSVLSATVFCVSAVAGQMLHAVKKWTEGYQWVWANPRATVGAMIGNLVGMVGFISTGALDDIPKISTIIALGLFMGLSADSVLNKGSKSVWTDEERAVKQAESNENK